MSTVSTADTASSGDAAASPERLVDHLFRHESGRLVALLLRRFGAHRLALVEDAVSGALVRALGTWAKRGVPASPEAWLTRVATNLVLDELRRDRRAPADELMEVGESAVIAERASEAPASTAHGDDQLHLLFACAHPDIPERARLVLCLKLVCGFGTREISARLFESDANVQKLLGRGRRGLEAVWPIERRDEFFALAADELARRLDVVLSVVYLVFNEGYSSERAEGPLRPDLCDDALRLGHLLATHPATAAPSTFALLALMHLHRARLDARVDADGELVPLEEQDRSRWDRAHLSAGEELLTRAMDGEPSRYHGEALVLSLHCFAPTFAETPWDQIVELYELLERRYPSPFYTLSRAIAVAEWRGPEDGLALLEREIDERWRTTHYLFVGTLGELARRAGDLDRARTELTRAVSLAPTVAERRLLEKRLERCG